MKVYRVTIKSGREFTVLARNAEKAIENMNRYAKRKYIYNSEVIKVEVLVDIEVVYK